MGLLLLGDERIPQLDSLAKKAVAFLVVAIFEVIE